MKKIINTLAVVICLSSASIASESNFIADELTGDTRLACEAILCLSSSERPAECDPSLQAYFSIKGKKWKDTLRKRKDFLKLCPAESSDNKYHTLLEEVLPHVENHKCDADFLNSRVETRRFDESRHKRINPQMPRFCELLYQHEYTSFKGKMPTYTCNSKFYKEEDWNRGWSLTEVSQQVYNKLNNEDREVHKTYTSERDTEILKFYKREFINKKCWVDKK